MLGYTIFRVSGNSMRPVLPHKSAGLFRAARSFKRSDVVLVMHPDHGLLVRKVAGVSKEGRVGLRSLARCPRSPSGLANVEPQHVVGKLTLRMRWARFLPRLASD